MADGSWRAWGRLWVLRALVLSLTVALAASRAADLDFDTRNATYM
eukprot:COSAG05_NODE_557_length_8701_cov_28.619972_8_plen_45_part_00